MPYGSTYRPPSQTGGYSQFAPTGGYGNLFGGYSSANAPAGAVGGPGYGGNLNSLLNYLLGSAVGGATGQQGGYGMPNVSGAPSSGLNPYHPSAFASQQAGMAMQPGGQFNASSYNPYASQIADLSKQFGSMSALPALDPASQAALAKIQQSQQANYNTQTAQMTSDLSNQIWAQGIPGSTGAQKLGTRLADQRSLGQAALDAASAQQQLGLRENLGQQQFQNLQAQLAALGQLNQFSAQGLQAQQQYQLQQQQFQQQQAAQRQQMLMSLMPMLMQMRAAQMQPSATAPIPQAMSIPKPQPQPMMPRPTGLQAVQRNYLPPAQPTAAPQPGPDDAQKAFLSGMTEIFAPGYADYQKRMQAIMQAMGTKPGGAGMAMMSPTDVTAMNADPYAALKAALSAAGQFGISGGGGGLNLPTTAPEFIGPPAPYSPWANLQTDPRGGIPLPRTYL